MRNEPATTSAATTENAGSSRRPNIVFIMADDMGYADLRCYRRRDLSIPNIDRIAERGVRLVQAYANSAVCSATRLAGHCIVNFGVFGFRCVTAMRAS